MVPQTFTAVARALALEAGDAILAVRASSDLGLRQKEDASPVTCADEAANAIILAGLREAFPQAIIVTEEDASSHSLEADAFFIVDPLDGTKDFLRGGEDFTVNIAYVAGGVARAGVIYAPATGRLFYTQSEGFAVEEVEGRLVPLRCALPDNAALRIVASKSHRDAATEAYIARYAMSDSKAAGSSLKFCLVAAGEADLYPRLGPTMEWDTAAGDAILRASGGVVVTLEGHAPLKYGKVGFRNPHFLALAEGVHLKD